MTAQQTVTTGENEFTVVRVFDAPIDLVFETMTTPEHLTHFWGPEGTSTPLEGIVVDLRPGGRFVTPMVSDADGQTFTMDAVFVEVERPTRLVWREAGPEPTVTNDVTFRAIDAETTEVTIVQKNLSAMYLSEEAQALAFLAGANSIFTGEKLLTTPNPDENADEALLRKLGVKATPPYGAEFSITRPVEVEEG